ncbi:hypothetical protein PPERSA_00192 [Pseudocohnilembus persalinus]|uniref:Uncharacterized protein n=1 Tax=Pseudocohnilembus persalinus TaxID=266149 RepID=A0A0V0QQL8_PSEPJ|nr:hypothetical protein PPERSA_00192 [Pseudocohnilembus persalinus]|eukprot:KRX04423.1 hypothetical protein PPERSA_00192 [Pseudocohnilembus persalinus]
METIFKPRTQEQIEGRQMWLKNEKIDFLEINGLENFLKSQGLQITFEQENQLLSKFQFIKIPYDSDIRALPGNALIYIDSGSIQNQQQVHNKDQYVTQIQTFSQGNWIGEFTEFPLTKGQWTFDTDLKIGYLQAIQAQSKKLTFDEKQNPVNQTIQKVEKKLQEVNKRNLDFCKYFNQQYQLTQQLIMNTNLPKLTTIQQIKQQIQNEQQQKLAFFEDKKKRKKSENQHKRQISKSLHTGQHLQDPEKFPTIMQKQQQLQHNNEETQTKNFPKNNINIPKLQNIPQKNYINNNNHINNSNNNNYINNNYNNNINELLDIQNNQQEENLTTPKKSNSYTQRARCLTSNSKTNPNLQQTILSRRQIANQIRSKKKTQEDENPKAFEQLKMEVEQIRQKRGISKFIAPGFFPQTLEEKQIQKEEERKKKLSLQKHRSEVIMRKEQNYKTKKVLKEFDIYRKEYKKIFENIVSERQQKFNFCNNITKILKVLPLLKFITSKLNTLIVNQIKQQIKERRALNLDKENILKEFRKKYIDSYIKNKAHIKQIENHQTQKTNLENNLQKKSPKKKLKQKKKNYSSKQLSFLKKSTKLNASQINSSQIQPMNISTFDLNSSQNLLNNSVKMQNSVLNSSRISNSQIMEDSENSQNLTQNYNNYNNNTINNNNINNTNYINEINEEDENEIEQKICSRREKAKNFADNRKKNQSQQSLKKKALKKTSHTKSPPKQTFFNQEINLSENSPNLKALKTRPRNESIKLIPNQVKIDSKSFKKHRETYEQNQNHSINEENSQNLQENNFNLNSDNLNLSQVNQIQTKNNYYLSNKMDAHYMINNSINLKKGKLKLNNQFNKSQMMNTSSINNLNQSTINDQNLVKQSSSSYNLNKSQKIQFNNNYNNNNNNNNENGQENIQQQKLIQDLKSKTLFSYMDIERNTIVTLIEKKSQY